LVSATDGDGLDQSLPMPGRFNHVITKATIDGKTYWLDGTRLGDRGVDTIAVPGFKWALPLDTPAAGLTALAATEPTLPQSEDRLDLDARDGIAKPAKASGSMTYRGEQGSQMRMALSVMPATDRDEMLRKTWTDRYSWITVKTADYRIDDKTGDVVFSFVGTAKMDWSDGGADSTKRYTTDNASLGRDIAPTRDKNPDAAPVAIDEQYTTARETILLPDGGKGFAVDGEAFDRTYGGVRYTREYSLKDGKFEMSATTRSKSGEISYADAKVADKQTDVLFNKALYITAPSVFGAPANEVAAAIPPVKPGDVAPDTGLTEITRLTVAGKNDEALKLIDTRIAGGDKTARTLAMRGQLLRNLGRTDAARDAYDQALAADRREPLAITGRAEMLLAAGRDEDALILYDRLVLLYPEAAEGYRRRASVRAAMGQVDGALSDIAIVLGKAPDDVDAHVLRTGLYIQRGRGAEAVDDARALVKLKPDDSVAHALLANVLAMTGKRVEAIAETDKSLALKPDGDPYRIRLRFDLEGDNKAQLADMVALIKYEPSSELPLAPLKHLMADPAAKTAILQAYDAAQTAEPDDADSITDGRDRAIAIGGDTKAYIVGIDARLAKKPGDASALNEACWARAWLKVDLDTALAQCDKSIAADRQAASLDSRGLVRLQRGEWAKAAADYGDAVGLLPTQASSLYGRGIARKRLGDLAGSKADLDAATLLDSKIGETYAVYGITP
jgi:tetratricopeptide (TPR) repeat protein